MTTQEQINQRCVETNSSYAFKTTADDCKETKLFDLVRSGTHTTIDLIAAERYDAMEWYKARAAYLEKRVAELEEKYEKKDETDDEDEDEDEEEHITEEQVVAEFYKTAEKHGLSPAQRQFGLETAKAIFNSFGDTIDTEKLQDQLTEKIVCIVRENAELKGEVQHLKLAGYYQKLPFTNHGELNTDDAAFDHYWSVDADDDLTLWKVPRHLADVKSAKTSYHGAVEQTFYDEGFGETHGKLKWFRVREMTEADLINANWKPKEKEQYTKCDDCGRYCYTASLEYPHGYTCDDCEEYPEETTSEDEE